MPLELTAAQVVAHSLASFRAQHLSLQGSQPGRHVVRKEPAHVLSHACSVSSSPIFEDHIPKMTSEQFQ